jgi:hypothetical protein
MESRRRGGRGGRGEASHRVWDQERLGKAERVLGVRVEMGVRRVWM